MRTGDYSEPNNWLMIDLMNVDGSYRIVSVDWIVSVLNFFMWHFMIMFEPLVNCEIAHVDVKNN